MTTLVMFSGGIDSTAMLVKLLAEGADELRVHHVAMYACYRARNPGEAHVEWIYPVYGMPKTEIVAALPAELLDLTWSCRRPVGGSRPCLVCKACKARQFAQGLRTPAEAAQNQIS